MSKNLTLWKDLALSLDFQTVMWRHQGRRLPQPTGSWPLFLLIWCSTAHFDFWLCFLKSMIRRFCQRPRVAFKSWGWLFRKRFIQIPFAKMSRHFWLTAWWFLCGSGSSPARRAWNLPGLYTPRYYCSRSFRPRTWSGIWCWRLSWQ